MGVDNRVQAVFVFLLVLELVLEQQIKILIGDGLTIFGLKNTAPKIMPGVLLEGQEN